MRPARAILLAGALALPGCEEEGGGGPPPVPPPGPRTAGPERVPAPTSAPRPPPTTSGMQLVEGAPDEAQLLARFQRAVAQGPESELAGCLHPSTRRAWLEAWVVELALESTAAPLDGGELREQKASMRALLRTWGVGGRPASLDEATVRETLLADVRDRDGLLVAILTFASKRGAPRDPVAALHGRRGGAPTGMASALHRLVEATRGARLVTRGPLASPVEESDGRFSRFVEADAGPRSLRFRREGTTVWLDES